MSYSKQEMLDWIEQELDDDAQVSFVSNEVGEEALIDDLLLDLIADEEDDAEAIREEFELEDDVTHVIFLP
jgi:hypothetical protein